MNFYTPSTNLPAARRGPFTYDTELKVNGIPRASSARLRGLLTASSEAKAKPVIALAGNFRMMRQLPFPKPFSSRHSNSSICSDESDAFYTSQCTHYGLELPPFAGRQLAKQRLLQALTAASSFSLSSSSYSTTTGATAMEMNDDEPELVVPLQVVELEVELRTEVETARRRLREDEARRCAQLKRRRGCGGEDEETGAGAGSGQERWAKVARRRRAESNSLQHGLQPMDIDGGIWKTPYIPA